MRAFACSSPAGGMLFGVSGLLLLLLLLWILICDIYYEYSKRLCMVAVAAVGGMRHDWG